MKLEYWILIVGAIIISIGFAITAASAGNIFTDFENELEIILSAKEIPSLSSVSVPIRLLEGEELELSIAGMPRETLLNLLIYGPEGTLLHEGVFSDRITAPISATINGEYEIIIGNISEEQVFVTAFLTIPGFGEAHDVVMPLIGTAFAGAILGGIGFLVLIAGFVMLIIFRVKRPKILRK